MTTHSPEQAVPMYDLITLGHAIQSKNQKLSNKIKQYADSITIRDDLLRALENMDAIIAIRGSNNDLERADESAIVAYLYSAIILYARATKTSSKRRGTLDLGPELSADEKVIHKELCELRDDAVAHFGSGGHWGDDFFKPGIFLRPKLSGGAEIMPISVFLVWDEALIARMKKQIQRAVEVATETQDRRYKKMSSALEIAMGDEAFRQEFWKHEANFLKFFGSQGAADRAMAKIEAAPRRDASSPRNA